MPVFCRRRKLLSGLLLLLAVAAGGGCQRIEPRPVRILTAGIRHESNTFCPLPTQEKDFFVFRGDEILDYVDWAQPLQEAGIELIPTLQANASPFGVVARDAYEKFKGEILERVRKALPVNGLYQDLHGALDVEGYPDAQADLVQKLREVVGPDTLLSASFDLHGNLSPELVRHLNIATALRTAPHVDVGETRARAVRLLLEALQKGWKPVTVLLPVPILIPGEKGITAREPLQSLYSRLPSLSSSREDLLDASILVGMAWCDVPRASMSVLVVARSEADRPAADAAARQLGRRLWEHRHELQFDVPTDTIDGAILTALGAPERPVFITDSGDNVTAGGAGDSTVVLERLLAHRVSEALLAGLVDPEAVRACEAAGVGQRVWLSVGGKLDTVFGRPLDVSGVVRSLFPSGNDDPAGTPAGEEAETAVVQVEGVTVVLLGRRRAFTTPEHFHRVGLDPLQYKIVVVKLGYLFQPLREIAPRTIMALTPGFAYQVVEELPYRFLRRPIYPLDPEMTWNPDGPARRPL